VSAAVANGVPAPRGGWADAAVAAAGAAQALRAGLHRWVYLLVGAALAVAFVLVLAWPVQAVLDAAPAPLLAVAGALVVVLVPVALAGLVGPVRTVEGAAVAALLTGGDLERVPPAATWRQRSRTAALLVAHVLAGGVTGALLVAGLPVAVLLVTAAAGGTGAAEDLALFPLPAGGPARLATGAALVVAALVGGDLLGRALRRLAPHLLASSPTERLAAAEAHVSVLAGRERLARELHDSVGHSLSLVSVQAGAARRLVTRDPAAAQDAMRATEDAARRALVDLDHVLGLLREEDAGPSTAPTPDLRDLDRLVASSRSAGTRVDAQVDGDVGALPAVVSREAYRIVQEGLTNALRHAPGAACRVSVDAVGDDVVLTVANTAPGSVPGPHRGGRGLTGVRERVRDLHGRVEAGPGADGTWRLEARLPVRARARGAS
jgi:signal transduction histidine kinase